MLQGNAVMADDRRGLILQRGGEELALEKLDDRFTIGGYGNTNTAALATQYAAQLNPGTTPAKMAELLVPPQQRDRVMESLRASGQVGFATHVYQLKNDPTSRIYLTDQITVQFGPSVAASRIAAITTEMGLKQIKPVEDLVNTFVMALTPNSPENPLKISNRLMQKPEVLTAEPNIVVEAQSHYRPKDSLYAQQWHLNHNGGAGLVSGSHIFAEQAWDVTRGHRSVIVAVMDDGVDLQHPDFQGTGKIVAPRDFKGRDFRPMPDEAGENHGTACAGVAVAEENGSGVVGVAPGCALMPMRTTGFLDDDTIEALFDWASKKGAAVISCSWGAGAVNYPLSLRQKAAITRAATKGRRGKGCVIVFAAGNANRPTNGMINEAGWDQNALSGPTKWYGGFTVHPDVITVGACTSLNRKAIYSNWGAEISVCAPSNNAPPGVGLPNLGYVATPPTIDGETPGRGIVTSDRVGNAGYDQGNYAPGFGGTSSACPLVAGVAALVLSANPQLRAIEVRQILQQTADKIVDNNPDPQFGLRRGSYESNGRCDWFGYGKVNAARAVQAARAKRATRLAPGKTIQAANNQAIDIPDGVATGVVSTIGITENGTIQDIAVTVDIQHSYLGDISVQVIAPSGDAIMLQGRNLGRNTQLQSTYTMQNTPALQLLLEQPTAGEWQLQVVDSIAGDTGKLNSWKMSIGI